MRRPKLERQSHLACSMNSTARAPKWVCKGRRRKLASDHTEDQQSCDIHLKVATSNVNTLAPQEARQAQMLGHGLLVTGKIQRLEKAFHEEGLDLVGMQEARLHGDVVTSNRTTIASSGRQPQSQERSACSSGLHSN